MASMIPGAHRTPGLGSLPRRLMRLGFLAWRNVWRNRSRSGLTAAALVAGLTLMITAQALWEGMFRQMTAFATQLSIGHLQVHRAEYVENQDFYALLPDDLAARLERENPHPIAPRLYAAGLASRGDLSSGAMIKAVDPVREPQVTRLHQHLRQGAMALSEPRLVHPRGKDRPPVPQYPVVIGPALARNLNADLGAEIVLITQAADGSIGNGLFEVVGILRPVDPAFDRMGVVMSISAYRALMALEQGVHELVVKIDAAGTLNEAKTVLERAKQTWPGLGALETDPGGPVRIRTWEEINPSLAQMLANSAVIVGFFALIVFSVSSLGMVNTILMSVHERRREMGVLLALGLGRKGMVVMVLLESFFLALISAVVGSGTGIALSLYLEIQGLDWSHWLPEGMDFMGIVFEPVTYGKLLPEQVVLSVVLMLGITMAAAFIPSWRSARLQPAKALHA